MRSRETIKSRQQRLGALPRACEACKIRKIRCDRAVPCSNCRASDLACQNVSPDANDRPESRTGAGKIRYLEAQISSLEQRLHNLESKAATPAAHPSGDLDRTEERLELSSNENELSLSNEDSRPFEGESTFLAHAVQASKAIEMHVDEVSGSDPALKDTLSHLNTLIQPVTSKEDYSFHSSLARLMPNIKLLPTTLVIGMLQRFKTRRPIFLSSYAVTDLELVENLCRSIYFPIKPICIGQAASMHGIFYFLLKEYEAMKDILCQQFDFPAQIAQCEKNFIMGLETYEIMSVPSFENILGLTMGAIKAQGEAKPFLYLSLISAAATHCQTLGYHRNMTYRDFPEGKAENIRRLFWTIYVFDKNTSLLLGKASQIQDCEIDTRYPSLPLDPSLRPWDESFLLGIKLAIIQGRIYSDLYSAGAASKSSFDRADAINKLVVSMEQWRADLESASASELIIIHVPIRIKLTPFID
ncbi:unnamed protein product [Penicillium olsonii]|uniref:Zn(2)-C6 fungal-type domain-containing protein n=1 Tax=Penicillium olsonii TaxID=99116 RepID=A0A9W4MUM4_PENOL|nr:unnamed protein product [Penicillium olsonii]CAG8141991.1 unnamed protein product [Penicillium olsonii]